MSAVRRRCRSSRGAWHDCSWPSRDETTGWPCRDPLHTPDKPGGGWQVLPSTPGRPGSPASATLGLWQGAVTGERATGQPGSGADPVGHPGRRAVGLRALPGEQARGPIGGGGGGAAHARPVGPLVRAGFPRLRALRGLSPRDPTRQDRLIARCACRLPVSPAVRVGGRGISGRSSPESPAKRPVARPTIAVASSTGSPGHPSPAALVAVVGTAAGREATGNTALP